MKLKTPRALKARQNRWTPRQILEANVPYLDSGAILHAFSAWLFFTSYLGLADSA